MPKSLLPFKRKGFSLAEIIMAIGVYSVIATMSIPKITTAVQSKKNQMIGKECIQAITDAYTQYRANNRLTSSFEPSLLLPYINSAKTFTGIVDDNPGWGSMDCSDPMVACVQMHSGAVLIIDKYATLAGTGNLNATYVMIDADGTYGGTSGSTNGKSLSLLLYANGFITSLPNAKTGTILFGAVIFTPWPQPDPDWFSWKS
jgi:type II secretory pathway pseudopilin PulG